MSQAEEGYLIPWRTDAGKVDWFARNCAGDTLLHVAVGRGSLDEVRWLVARGLDVNARGEFHETPLFVAAQAGHREIHDALLEMGADAGIPDYMGVLPREMWRKGEDP